jgi:hypothetical protein
MKILSGAEPNPDRGQDRMKQKSHKIIQPQNTVLRPKTLTRQNGVTPHKQKPEIFAP